MIRKTVKVKVIKRDLPKFAVVDPKDINKFEIIKPQKKGNIFKLPKKEAELLKTKGYVKILSARKEFR